MTRLPVVSGREVIVAMERLGYVVVRQRGSHVRMRHPTKTDCHPVTVPQHRTLKTGTLRAIIRDANLSLERFRELFPDARVERIEEAGHWVVEDATERVIATVDRFLAETCSAGTVRSVAARPTADPPDERANQE